MKVINKVVCYSCAPLFVITLLIYILAHLAVHKAHDQCILVIMYFVEKKTFIEYCMVALIKTMSLLFQSRLTSGFTTLMVAKMLCKI